MSEIVTPAQVERRLRDLSRELDEAHENLVQAEHHYATTKSSYEIAIATTRIKLSNQSRPDGKNYSVQEREDIALVENKALHIAMGEADAVVRASRANSVRIKIQIDSARSVGTLVRAGFDV